MHETGIALEILRMSERIVQQQGGGRILRARVAVGELSAVEPDLLRYAWEAVVAGTPAEGARLEVEFFPARQRCPQCGPVERRPGSWVPLCLGCGAPLTVEGGAELDLLQVEFEPQGEAG
ncbi:MAG: hydrogenase maturation nickel metallochaperone HypA [Thermoanaerobaculum sp.]|nr:hydrogenase maturation nickel metallochaperone HypA [Thermoanaerobaculum sp.]MDW7967199.1 hydrogenase maturation nickel metallochaperone HypA [Thermoanaerobaculum sp.]